MTELFNLIVGLINSILVFVIIAVLVVAGVIILPIVLILALWMAVRDRW